MLPPLFTSEGVGGRGNEQLLEISSQFWGGGSRLGGVNDVNEGW